MPAVKTKIWADEPFELIETPEFAAKNTKSPDADYIKAASFMTLMHNILIRGMNSIYNQAPFVAEADLADFVAYSGVFCEVLDNHTRGEEVHMFPEIEKATGQQGLMSFNTSEHDQITPHLLALKTYLQTPHTPTTFSATHLQSLLTTLSVPLLSHFRSEIPEITALSRFGSSLPILKIFNASGKKMTEELDKETGFMWFLLNCDTGFEGGMWSKWPPIPGLVKWTMVKTNSRKYAGWWRFASCGNDGKRKDLFAVV